jgi:threonine dehydrogenase-like Zn-dependent dehydrogenase
VTTIELELKTASAATLSTDTAMKALVYHGPRKRAWENKPRPTIQEPGDAIVRITTSTICGTDLHILKGDLPAVTEGRILGHEGIGNRASRNGCLGVLRWRQGHHLVRYCLPEV